MSYKKEKLKEPLILEPEDWTKTEWKTICKLFGQDITTSQRIVIKGRIETFNEL